MDILQCLGGLPQGQAEIYPVGQAQGHDIGVVPAELQRGRILWKGGNVHPEEIYREFAVDVMQLVFVFAVFFLKVILVYLLQVMKIVRALRVDTFVDDEVFTVLLAGKGVRTVRAFQGKLFGKTVLIRGKPSAADLAQELSGFTVISVQVGLGSLTEGAGTVFRDITFGAAPDRGDRLAILPGVIAVEVFPVPVLMVVNDLWELVHLELLIFGRV